MPQQGYFYPQYYNNSATTTNYQIIQPVWTSNNATTIYYPHRWVDDGNQYRPIVNQTNAWYQAPAVSQDEVWQQWVITVPQSSYSYQPQVMTAEAIIEADRRMREEREQRHAARTRARVLLGEFLDDDQKVELERHGRFHVTGSRGRRYCIRAEGQAGNVDLLKPDGGVQARLCCHPRQGLPDGDAWLMQMIEIRHDEDHFLRTANVHRGSLPVAA